jgi:hypothetical protein
MLVLHSIVRTLGPGLLLAACSPLAGSASPIKPASSADFVTVQEPSAKPGTVEELSSLAKQSNAFALDLYGRVCGKRAISFCRLSASPRR